MDKYYRGTSLELWALNYSHQNSTKWKVKQVIIFPLKNCQWSIAPLLALCASW